MLSYLLEKNSNFLNFLCLLRNFWKFSTEDVHSYKFLTPLPVQILPLPCNFGNIWQNRMLVSPGGLAPSPWGNPGSATVSYDFLLRKYPIKK